MKIMKFGGTSVGCPEGINKIIEIIRSQDEQAVLVFSALAGVTNMLNECLCLAEKGNPCYLNIINEIEKRHFVIADCLMISQKKSKVMSKIKQMTSQLLNTLEGISYVGEKTLRSSDMVLSFGEMMSVEVIKAVLAEKMIQATHLDSREFIFTKYNNGCERLETEMTEKAISEKFSGISGLIITSGYIASSVKGYPATLGRGGSDYTAAILAAALDASILEIWTDVSGIYTADPRYSEDAYPIPELSYTEALELSHFGAKVIYPPTIQPVLKKRIPVLVKNTFLRDDRGTLISDSPVMNGNVVKAISSIDDISMVSLTGAGMAGVAGIASRLFTSLAHVNINVILITQASSEQSICLAIYREAGERACEALNEEFAYEIHTGRVSPAILEHGFSIVAMVGERMKYSVGICGQAFSALGRNGINIHAIAQGSSELNVSVVVKSTDCHKAVNAIHQEFFHSVNRVINLFIVGTGKVGSAFVEQILSQAAFFTSEYQIEFRIAGLANSRKMLVNKAGIKDKSWKEKLMNEGIPMNLRHFTEEMFNLNLPNSIFIDNTASEKVSLSYKSILSKSISIVTCNKIAASSSFENYSELKRVAVSRRVHFRFESNVGAGLPIIQTISNLVKTGDRINKIEAVVSGSLNFIFNNYCNGMKFSSAVMKAMDEGYTEPDPLVDLKGTDVSRKLLILVREAGIRLEDSDIAFESYLPHPLPAKYMSDKFTDQIKEYDDFFEKRRSELTLQKKKIRVVAKYEQGRASISLMEVDQMHPFFNLEGNDNVVSIMSKRYLARPLIIKGAGAGADVTASGIFSDILSIINN